jgi:hypothetical protein
MTRRRAVDVQKRWLLFLCAVLGSSACVIGPKQDDPVSGATGGKDTGVSAEDSSDRTDDTGTVDDATVEPPGDAGGGADTSTSTDSAAADAPADGSDGGSDGDAGSDDGSLDGVSVDGSPDAETIDATDALTEGG